MNRIPLRRALRYDPVFLELGKRLGCGEFGSLTGISVSSVIGSTDDLVDLIAFWVTFFGRPTFSNLSFNPHSSLAHVVLLFDGFGLSMDTVVIGSPETLLLGAIVTGSVSCSRAFVEFRFGTEKLLSYAREEGRTCRVALPEGDGAYYAAMDEASSDVDRVVREESDAAALRFARDLVTEKTAAADGQLP